MLRPCCHRQSELQRHGIDVAALSHVGIAELHLEVASSPEGTFCGRSKVAGLVKRVDSNEPLVMVIVASVAFDT